MPGKTLTSANAVFTLWQTVLYPQPQLIQGFAADDVTDTDEVQRVITSMGVDGKLSAGFVFAQVEQRIVLQADSDSLAFFQNIDIQQQGALDAYVLTGNLVLPGLQLTFSLTTGYLTRVKPIPHVARTIQPPTYRITWGKVLPQPLATS